MENRSQNQKQQEQQRQQQEKKQDKDAKLKKEEEEGEEDDGSEEEEEEDEEEEQDDEDDDEEPQIVTAIANKDQRLQPQQQQQPAIKSIQGRIQQISKNEQNQEKFGCYTDRVMDRGNVDGTSSSGKKSRAYLGNNNSRPQAWINQKNLQIKFLEDENHSLKQSLKDIESSLRINKEMLSTILQDASDIPNKEKSLMLKLSKENGVLIEREKGMKKEREDFQANQLINQQIIEDLRAKEEELVLMNEEQIKQLQDKLEKKEYSLQVCELKIYHYEKYLQRKALTEKEGRQLLFKFQQDDPKEGTTKITNVVEDNLQLRQELKEAFQEVNALQEQLQELSGRIVDLEEQLKAEKSKEGKTTTTTETMGMGMSHDRPVGGEGHENDPELSIFDQSTTQGESVINLDKLKRMEKYFPKEYQQRLELMLLDMEKQMKTLKKERKFLKSENTVLKENNDSNQFVIQKLNTALTKATSRIKILEDKMGVHDKILLQQQQQQQQHQQISSLLSTPHARQELLRLGMGSDEFEEKVLKQLGQKELARRLEAEDLGLDPNEFGNLSSIMINPNEISNALYASNVLATTKGQGQTFNFAKEMEMDEKRKSLI